MSPRYAYRLGWRSLRRVCPHLTERQAKQLARDLGQAMVDHQINTARRARLFIATVAHESGGFRYREEIASGAAYEGRRDLGNTRRGDGRRFKGRGYIQITGRSNYERISRAWGVDFVANPQRLALPRFAAKSAAWWWQANGCNQIADTGSLTAVTRRVNGGLNGLADRRRYYDRTRLVAPFLVPKRRKP